MIKAEEGAPIRHIVYVAFSFIQCALNVIAELRTRLAENDLPVHEHTTMPIDFLTICCSPNRQIRNCHQRRAQHFRPPRRIHCLLVESLVRAVRALHSLAESEKLSTTYDTSTSFLE